MGREQNATGPADLREESDRDGASSPLQANAHAEAAAAFVERARSRFGERLEALYVFGSTVRGEARGLASDVDVLVVLGDDEFETTAEGLRELAYDVMLEYGPVVELHVLSTSTFDRYQRENNPFIQNVVTEGRMPEDDDGEVSRERGRFLLPRADCRFTSRSSTPDETPFGKTNVLR